jgi:hypothetical protein
MYVSRRCPPLLMDEITTYVPINPSQYEGGTEWAGIFRRMFEHEDDGHAVKLVRAVAFGESVGKQGQKEGQKGYEGEEWARVKGSMWKKIGNMVADSVEDTKEGGSTWARNVGFDEAWAGFEDRPLPAHL